MSTGEQHTTGPVLPVSPPQRGPLIAAFVGVDLVIVGAVLLVWRSGGQEFGWFAYSAGFGSDPVFWVVTFRQSVGAALVAVGLAVVAGSLGYRAGLKRSARTV